MSGSRWLYPLAVGGFLAAIFLAAPALAQDTAEPIEDGERVPVDQPSQQRPAEEDGAKQPEASSGTADSASAVQQDRAAEETCGPRCQEAAERDKRDLVAQESMANSTSKMVLVAWIQAGISVLAVALVACTIYYTRTAAIAAERAVEAARTSTAKTIKAMRKAAKQELRAYIFIKKSRAVKEDDEVGLLKAFTFSIRNAGQTPARDVVVRASAQALVSEEEIPETAGRMPGTYLIGPDSENTITILVPNEGRDDDIVAFYAGDRTFFLFGRVDYTNAFGERCHTNFRTAYTMRDLDDGLNLRVCRQGNSAT